MTTPNPAEARARRRRHLHQRQTVVLGTLVLALTGTLLLAWLMWGGVIPSPFERDFTSPPPEESTNTVACPPEGAVTVGLNEITASVYNSTSVGGLARSVSSSLSAAGVTINQTANWDELYTGVGFLRTGILGLEEAYTLQMAFPGMIVTKDAREDALVDVVLGSEYGSIADLTTIVPGLAIPVPAECQAESPTAEPTETAGTEPPEGTAPAEAPAEG
ncbi:MAG: LytR C-terminal domain-containing protein [Actinomycetota bacterium]